MDLRLQISAIFILMLLVFVNNQSALAQESAFQATLDGEEVIELTGKAPLIHFPSMFSIYLEDEEGRCAIHLSGYREIPTGTFSVASKDSLSIRSLCVLNNVTPRERLLAETGTLTIDAYNRGYLSGKFDMSLTGGITSKVYKFTGHFTAYPPEKF